MSAPRPLLFVGDFACTTGFGRVNEAILTRLNREKWTPHVLAINASGDPHPLKETIRVYPAREDGHPYGVNRFAGFVQAIRPAVVVVHQDAWIVPIYLDAAADAGVAMPPVVAYCPPDSPNQHAGVKLEGRVARLLCPTAFGTRELCEGGYTGPSAVLPYGVDTTIFRPTNRAQARRDLGFPERFHDGFVVGRADRNAQRKRYDLTFEAWALWWTRAGKPENAALQLNCVPREVIGWDLPQLAGYYGIKSQVLFSVPEDSRADHLPASTNLATVYASWDVHLSTVHGEGWGLVAHESAACRIAQVVPSYAAYDEWLKDAALFIPVKDHHHHTAGINTMGGVVRVEDVAAVLDRAYRSPKLLDKYSALAYARATEERFSWDVIARQFETHLDEVAG